MFRVFTRLILFCFLLAGAAFLADPLFNLLNSLISRQGESNFSTVIPASVPSSRSNKASTAEFAGLALIRDLQAQSLAAEFGSKPLGVYTKLDPRDGVYNNGQAALWDLHIIDYFRIFGPPQRARGYQPEQPIAFSHVTHVQKNQMECQYCHWSVAKSAYAAIPEEEACMGCHKMISSRALQARSDQAAADAEKAHFQRSAKEIEKLEGYYSRSELIPWVKVHVMPDYVHFNHKRHVKAGVACQECHGQVPNMQVVERVTSMKMGWCVECHRERAASIDCYTCHY